MTKTLDRLGEDHLGVLQRLAEVETAIGRAASDFSDFAGFLESEVMQHFALEEQALFPLLARHLGVDDGPLAVMNSEHATFRRLLGDLRDGVRAGDGAAQRRAGGEIVSLLRAHIAKEDNVLFPMAARVLSPEEQNEVEALAQAMNSPAS
jgi:hemerythrin-like domain-containing protein